MVRASDSGKAAGRRAWLVRSLAGGALALAPPALHGPAAGPSHHRRPAPSRPAPVPSMTVSLADFGGRPGVGRALLVEAFQRGFAMLSRAGGGTLFVPPGRYDFGAVDEPLAILVCRDLRDIAILAYGAVFIANTTAAIMPNMFYFYNFNNVSLAGATFVDLGFTPWVDWQGMYCVGIQADKPSSGMYLVDCRAERVTGLLASNNNAAGRQWLSDIHVHGEVRNAYYGVGANYVREHVIVNLDCHNVRRAFIAYAARRADVTIRASADEDWPGSNGLVALVCAGASQGNVEDVRVRVDVSGACIHGSYVHFYHQGPQRDGAICDIDATVDVDRMRAMTCMFLFDHETHGVLARTARQWDRIRLHGSVDAECTGAIIDTPTLSTAPGTVSLDSGLARSRRTAIPTGVQIRSD